MSLQNPPPDYYFTAQEDRSDHRLAMMIPAKLRVPGLRAFPSVVNDLSLSGFSASAVMRMHPGSVCWLTLPGLESQQSEVVWWDEGLVGCAFVNLLSPIVHDAIVTRYSGEQ